MKNIEEKPKLKKEETPKPVEEKKLKSEIIREQYQVKDISQVISEKGDSPDPPQFPSNAMKHEHAKLAIMYSDLNDMVLLSHREPGLAKMKAREIDNLRESIKNYETVHGITRADHLRWSGF